MRVVIVVLIGLAALSARDLRAQDADANQLQTFTHSDFYAGLINRSLATIPKAIFQRCPTLVSNGSQVTIIKPVRFAKSGFPNDGVWKQSFPISGCGNDTVLNVFYFADANEKINTVVGMAGTTHADLRLQRDTLMYVNAAASGVTKDCKTFDVKTTRFEGFGLRKPPTPDPGPGSQLRPWWETWTLVGCGHTVDVPVDYVPTEKGTQIIQPLGDVIER